MAENSTDIVEVLASPVPEGSGEGNDTMAASGSRQGSPLRCIYLEEFSSPMTLSDTQKDSYLRRFGTLFVDEGRTREGGTSRVLHGVNAYGEHFALKMRKPVCEAGKQEDLVNGARSDEGEPVEASFQREYQVHQLLSDIKGYPYLYGQAQLDGQPVIVMEWIDGEDLLHAGRRMVVDDEGRISPLTVARLGRDLFDVLARTSVLDQSVVHGDLSLRNIMLSTKQQSVETQIQEGTFNLRLIDLSSSRVVSATAAPMAGSKGAESAFIGGATQEFAAPELDSEGKGASPSQAADVYAVASILCLLVYGNANPSSSLRPFKTAHDDVNDIAAVLGREPEVAVAVQRAAAELAPCPTAQEIALALAQVDEPLAELLRSCLVQNPVKRPTAAEMREALDSFCSSYAMNVGRALRGEQLEPCRASFAHGGIAGLSLKARNLIRVIGKSVSIGLAAAVMLTTALVLYTGNVSVDLKGTHLEGFGAGAMAVLLVLPALLGLLFRGAQRYSLAGLLRGSAGIVVGGACLGAVVALADFKPSAMGPFYGWAMFAVAVMTWCPFVLDCAFPTLSARVQRRRRALPQSAAQQAGAGGSSDVLLGLTPAGTGQDLKADALLPEEAPPGENVEGAVEKVVEDEELLAEKQSAGEPFAKEDDDVKE